MLKALKRWWKYLTARTNKAFDERADPAVQLEQAITEAQEQHRRLREQAANVIAQQKQTELQLNRKLDELERTNATARQAVLMADEATKNGDTKKAAEYTQAAESIANKLIALEGEVESLKTLHYQTTQAADQAKAAVQQNSQMLQKKLAEKQKLAGQLEQAKMQEQMNTTMASLSETVGEDVPTLNEVRDKIEARFAKAKGMAELNEGTVEGRMLEVEQAVTNVEAQTRLAEIRASLGIAAPAGEPQAAVASGGDQPAVAPAAEPAPAPAAPAPEPAGEDAGEA